ncbi:MAG TPA: hypothetical protein VJ955_00625 [Desulfuromonadales bacterium]|nr:hypothetical protein [Desulfuromonadales bacterium]
MKATWLPNAMRMAVTGSFLLIFATTPAFARWMGAGMGNAPATRSVSPAALPDPGSPGAWLLQTRCTQCHGLFPPSQYPASQWSGIVEEMNRRMAGGDRGMGMGMMMRGAVRPLSALEEATLISYLQAHAGPPPAQTAQPGSGSPAPRSFTETCSRCHKLPSPSAYSASQWPSVVGRMEQYVLRRGGSLTAAQKEAILNYLKENARKN